MEKQTTEKRHMLMVITVPATGATKCTLIVDPDKVMWMKEITMMNQGKEFTAWNIGIDGCNFLIDGASGERLMDFWKVTN